MKKKNILDAPPEVLKALSLYFRETYPKMTGENIVKNITRIMNKMGYYRIG